MTDTSTNTNSIGLVLDCADPQRLAIPDNSGDEVAAAQGGRVGSGGGFCVCDGGSGSHE